MQRSTLYLTLAVIGAAAPWALFVRFFAAEGLGGDFVAALFVNGAAGGFTVDLLVSSCVFWIYLFAEARACGVGRPWIFVVVNLVIGLSCALPLFLWAREGALRRHDSTERGGRSPVGTPADPVPMTGGGARR